MANETIITVTGNLTADPEIRQAGDATVANFTIASTPRKFDKNSNEWKDEETLFLRSSAWRELAENIGATLHKGSRVIAQGSLKQRSYDKDGEKRTVFEFEILEIGVIVPRTKPNAQRAGGQPQAGAGNGVAPGLQQPMSQAAYSEDIPF